MCGISGIYRLDGNRVDEKIVIRMNDVLKHRGPDDSGQICIDNVGLANKRLAIIDTTSSGHQPMKTDDGLFWITFNGEIFNYKNLRHNLEKNKVRFKSNSDTEVILKGYQFYGESFIRKLRGQFAFCIWDKKNKQLILARDQMGINPLYYAQSSNTFIFASEVKAILASGLVKRKIDNEALHHYLSFFMIPAPLTIIKDIKSLLPGHIMKIDQKGIKMYKYWSLDKLINSFSKKDLIDPKKNLKNLLIQAVSDCLIADVPVGAFLSGGIDSSTVVALMAQRSRKPVKTFSLWVGEGSYYDERRYSRLIAQKFNTDHLEFTITENTIKDELPKIVYFFDQPTGGSFENYFVSKAASNKVKVVLSGLGGDELFAGYHGMVHKTQLLSAIYSRIPVRLKDLFLESINRMPVSQEIKKTIKVADKFLSLSSPLERRLFIYFAYQEVEKRSLYTKEFLSYSEAFSTDLIVKSYWEQVKDLDPIDQLSYIDLSTYTRDDLLLGTNLMGMAHSVETRVPLLDTRLVKFAFSLPPNFKLRDGISKFILKEVVRQWLPREIIEHKKTGFGIPREKFMRNGLKPYILSLLNFKNVEKRGLFNPVYVKKIVDQFYADTSDKMLWKEHLRVWTLFVLELWCRIYLDRETIAPPSVSLDDIVNL